MTFYQYVINENILHMLRANQRKINIWTRQRYPNANKGIIIGRYNG